MKFLKNLTSRMIVRLFTLVSLSILPGLISAAEKSAAPMGTDVGIEGLQSQQFSVAIFYFLITAIFIFLVFIFMFMLKTKATKLKTGEKWLFAWLLLGVLAAIVFGSAQMLHGYLF